MSESAERAKAIVKARAINVCEALDAAAAQTQPVRLQIVVPGGREQIAAGQAAGSDASQAVSLAEESDESEDNHKEQGPDAVLQMFHSTLGFLSQYRNAEPEQLAAEETETLSFGGPIHDAAMDGNCAAIRNLHASGVSLSTPNKEGLNALFIAAIQGREEAVRLIVELGGVELLSQLSVAPQPGFLPIHLVMACEDEPWVVRFVFFIRDCGAGHTLSQPTASKGLTPAHFAASEGHPGVIRALAECGAKKSLSAPCLGGSTPLHRACIQGFDSVVEALYACGVKKLTVGDTRGNTPLHGACLDGNAATLRLLCRLGARPAVSQPNVDGTQPMHLAAHGGHTDCMLLLHEMDADISARNGQGHTPSICAASYGHAAAVRLLHDMGADIGAAARGTGWTGAHMAAQNGHVRVLRLLGELGFVSTLSQVNSEDHGMTPAHGAAGNHRPEAIKVLHEFGAVIDAPSRDTGRNPAHLAGLKGDTETLAMLVKCEAGASLLAPDVLGTSAVEYACDEGRKDWLQQRLNGEWKDYPWAAEAVQRVEAFIARGDIDPATATEAERKRLLVLQLQDKIRLEQQKLLADHSRARSEELAKPAGWRWSVLVCALCGVNDAASTAKFKRCSACRAAAYCSKGCQLAHWRQHKRVCAKPK